MTMQQMAMHTRRSHSKSPVLRTSLTIHSLGFLVFGEPVLLTVSNVPDTVHVARTLLLDIVVGAGTFGAPQARSAERPKNIIQRQPVEEYCVDDKHHEHGCREQPVEAGADSVPPQPHPVQDPHLCSKAEQDEGDEVDVGVEAVQPVAEVKLHHLHQLARVQEDRIDLGQQRHTVVGNAVTVDDVVEEHATNLQKKKGENQQPYHGHA